MNMIGAVLLVALAIVGVLTVGRALVKHFAPKPQKAEEACVHQWEPWSDKQETDVKEASFGNYGYTKIREKEYKGAFQERVCSKCNQYARRWC